MNTHGLKAGASRFAHFAGLTRASRSAEDDDDRRDDDEPKGKRSKAAEDDDDDDPDHDVPKGKRSRRAEDDDDRRDDDEPKGKRSKAAEDDDEEDPDHDAPKGKRSKAAEDDDGCDDEDDRDREGRKSKRSKAAEDDDDEDDDKDEMHGRSARASARRREQSRIAAILGHSAAARNLPLAVSLACETRMTRREAIAVLRSQPAGGADRDDDRSASRHARAYRMDRNPELGSDAPQRGSQAVSASWDNAFKKAGITTR